MCYKRVSTNEYYERCKNKKSRFEVSQNGFLFCESGWSRTTDPLLKRQMLYYSFELELNNIDVGV